MYLIVILFTMLSHFFLGAFVDEKTHFPFLSEPIDVVIPSVEKDLKTLELCIEGIKAYGDNVRRVIVVSKKKLTDKAEWYSEDCFPFSFKDIALALANDNKKLKRKLLISNSRTGWYFQQLIKLYAPLVIPNISSNVLVLDSDTIFLNPVTFLNNDNGGCYNTGTEYHSPYFDHAALLIPGFKKLFPEASGISHHMVFQKPVIEELINRIESYHFSTFWKVFCQLVGPDQVFYSGASEYEIYFNYVFSRTDQTSIRLLKWKNINKLSEIPTLKNKDFHYVSIHSYDRIEE